MDTRGTDECVVPLLEPAPTAPSFFRTHLKEAFRFCVSAAPISIQCTNYAIFIAAIQMWVGHLSTTGLAAVALGVQLNRALGFFMVHYLTSSMETIAGQAIGAKEYRIVGLTLQKVLLMNVVFLVPLFITAFQSEKLLLLFHQDPEVASSVQEFLMKSLAGTLFQVLADVGFRYMSLNSYHWPIFGAQLMAIAVGLASGRATINTPEGAVHGAAVSTVAYSGSLLPITVIGVVCLHRASGKNPETKIWHGFSIAAFQGWGHYLRVGGGALLMFAPKQFFMEYLFLVTGTLAERAAASTAIAVSMLWVVTAQGVGVGFNVSAMACVGRAIGAGNLELTKVRVRTYSLVALMLSTIFAAVLVVSESRLSLLWTNDPEVLNLLRQMKWPTAISILFSWVGMICLGILCGLRRQFWGACVTIPSFLIFGFGMAPVLVIYLGWGTLGASISFTSVMVCEAVVVVILLFCVNYEKEHARVGESMRLSRPLE
ncbi:hypothetical protein BSKO_04695 [Bryopsis sp. KO-2023]|nr:hypothetical protein BSKO_04695 [Bryopsis sp. KO-2023]